MNVNEKAVLAAVMLRESRGRWLLPDVLARDMGIGEADFRAAIRQLKQSGYQIDVRPGGALRLAAGRDRLDPAEILCGLDVRTIGCRVEVLAETGSTSDDVWSRLAEGAPEGITVLAESQTAGRGRQGRRWFAPPRSSVLMSVGVTPDLRLTQTPLLTFAASIAAVEAMRSAAGVNGAIEWPNDVMCGGRKAAGILVEGRRLQPSGPAFVIGFGINANVPRAAFPGDVRGQATSLAAECDRPVDRVLLTRHLLRALDTWYAILRDGDTDLIQRRWLELSATVGRPLVIEQAGRQFGGVVVDVSPADGLALRLGHGEIRHFQPQSVTVVQRSPSG